MEGVVLYEDLELNLFRGSVHLKNVDWRSNKNESQVKIPHLKVVDVSYYALLFNDQIKIANVSLSAPHIFLHQKTDSTPTDSTKKEKEFEKEIVVKKVEVDEGSFVFKKDTLEKLNVSSFKFEMDKLLSNKEVRKEDVPFNYENYDLNARNFYLDMNNLQKLKIKKLDISNKSISFRELHMMPKHTKEKYIEHISYEKDWMDLKIEELIINEYNLDLGGRKRFSSPLIKIQKLNFDIFRDKTVKDDVREKDMYSKMVRDLDFGIHIDSIHIASSYLRYGEQLQKPGPPATIFFEDFNVGVSNVTNLDLEREDFPYTNVEIKTQFMGKSALNFNWSFKVNDTLDRFTVKGSGYGISDTSVNSFFTPAYNMEAEGGVEEVYYNFSGNRHVASGDIKLEYEKFKLHILKKDRERKNKILSFLANIVVKNSSKTGGVSKNIGQVKRDKTKSFWNYFWSCLEAGLKKVLI